MILQSVCRFNVEAHDHGMMHECHEHVDVAMSNGGYEQLQPEQSSSHEQVADWAVVIMSKNSHEKHKSKQWNTVERSDRTVKHNEAQ